MTPRSRITTAVALIICTVLPAWGQQYLLYTPQPATPGQTSSQDGILVQEIEIRKGDTLYDLSRKFSGRGMYYPQILLFNSIRNPNLIYAGKTLRVPLAQNVAHDAERTHAQPSPLRSKDSSAVSGPGTELPVAELKTGGAEKSSPSRLKKKADARVKKSPAQAKSARSDADTAMPLPAEHKSMAAPSAADSAAGQKLFEAAVKSYRQDDCRTALELLDRYLADNSGSPLAADANLYKAECYLKLSAQ